MKSARLLSITVLAAALFAAGCANTIRGVGRDTANAVDATESAGKDVVKSAE